MKGLLNLGHQISAILLKGPFDADRAAEFDMRPIDVGYKLTLFPLDAYYIDFWTEKLGFAYDSSNRETRGPIVNCRVVHHMVNSIADNPLFAVIETDYFGGVGDQCAVVYHGAREIMPPTAATRGPINQALRMLGVYARKPADEFDTIGLGSIRHWDDVFRDYHQQDD